MPDFTPFALEEFMSRFEQEVDVNLSESGVHPMTLGELLAAAGRDLADLAAIPINYPHVEGIPSLREAIASLYPGAEPDNVLVTVGAAEANYDLVRSLVEPGDRVAVMMPNYLQVWGVATNAGAEVSTFDLRQDAGWALDIDALTAATTGDTRLISVCNPNNPTGKALTGSEMQAIVDAAESAGAWLLADEVYRGAERVGDTETPSFWGLSSHTLAVGSMSKAYGLPGLRVGWVVAPPEIVDRVWRRHEYSTISASMLSNHLAAMALSPGVRPGILERTRGFIRRGYPIVEEWAQGLGELVTLNPPDAAAITFLGYAADVPSTVVADRIRREQSALVIAGSLFGVDQHLRVSFGLPPDLLADGLDRVARVLTDL